MEIRPADIHADYNGIWDIFKSVISTGDTYVFDANTPNDKLQEYWFTENMDTFVVVENGIIVGTYIIKVNYIDRGNHIANCSYGPPKISRAWNWNAAL